MKTDEAHRINLLIGFTKSRKFHLLQTIGDVRHFVENYVPTKEFFIGDLSQFSEEALAVLLKFLEERVTDAKIECYASKDNLNPTILSRFQSIKKQQRIKPGKDRFVDFLNMIPEKGSGSDALLEGSPQSLDKYLIYRRMPPGIKDRVADLL